MPEWVVSHQEAGVKLIAFLSSQLGSQYSSRSVKRAIENNCCQINGRIERFASTLLGAGDHISFALKQNFLVSENPHFNLNDILYEDDALLAYNKPAGLTCDEQGVLRLLKSYHPHLRLVHRLDRDTSGILLLAKNQNVFDDFVNQFKLFAVHKSYKAIVDKVLKKAKGTIENYLGKKHTYEGQTIWGAVKAAKGLYACTEWQSLRVGREASLVACYPKTGRTHQLRVHLAEMGHAILGDFQYCKQFHCTYKPQRCLLHAEEIHFKHPQTKENINLYAPLPVDFLQAQKILF